MIPIRQFKELWDYVADNISDTHGDKIITGVYLVDDESHMNAIVKNKISNKQIFLVARTPSSDEIMINQDNFAEMDQVLIYVLKKISAGDMSEEDLMDEREQTQVIMTRIKQFLKDLMDDTDDSNEFTMMLKSFYRSKKHTDRERNFLECNGWSLSFGLQTNSYDNTTFIQ